MIPWCFAYDHLNYAKYQSAYVSEMSHLDEDHPEVLEYFRSGGFSVQIGNDNTFGRIPVDQTCEETVNKGTQTVGETKGFSLKPGAVAKYCLTAEYRCTFMRQLKDMLHINTSDNTHSDLQQSRITKDETDVRSLLSIFENTWTNPFILEHQELCCLSTGKVAPHEIEQDLLQAKCIGEKSYKSFSATRLEPGPKKVSFNEKTKKLNLKTFSSLNKKIKVQKGTPKEVILKADRALFAKMIIIAESRKLKMREVLCHPLGPLPWALAASDGSMRKTSKSTLANEVKKNVPAVDSRPQPSATIIDGMALVQRMKGNQRTFAEAADCLFLMVLNEGRNSHRIDVVFDVYRENSIKNAEREKRGSETGGEYKNIRAEHKLPQWRKFLLNPNNKSHFIKFVYEEWQKKESRVKLQNNILFVTSADQCCKLSFERAVLSDELRSTHEEADTRMILHAAHASSAGYQAVIISSQDTDVLLLCMAFKASISCPLYLKCGSQTRTQYISISTVVQLFGPEVCKALPGLHAFTGCDSVSAFAGKGKLSAVKLSGKPESISKFFQELGTEWQLSDELFSKLQSFTGMLYSPKPGTCDVNELRYRLFCAKKGELESQQIPPCADALKKHLARANYQAAVWRRSLEGCPQVPHPVGFGWILDDGKLAVDWMSGEPAPRAVLELLSCKCRKTCKLPKCTCLAIGLNCTDMCILQDCNNRQEEDNTDVTFSDDEEDE